MRLSHITLQFLMILCLALAAGGAQAASQFWTADEGLSGTEIRIANEGDGTVEIVTLADKQAVRNTNVGTYPGVFIYLDIADTFTASHVWVTVEYLDQGTDTLGLHYDGISSNYLGAERSVGNYLSDSVHWRTATFELKTAQFLNGENYGMDMRFATGGTIALHSVTVSDQQDTFFWSAAEMINGTDFRVLDAGDGMINFVSLSGRPAIENEGDASNYYYFDAPASFTSALVYVIAEMYDQGSGQYTMNYDSYQPPGQDDLMTKYRGADESYGNLRLATGKWKTVAFVLTQAQFLNRENGNCDFRFWTAGTGAMSSLRIYDHKPAYFDELVAELTNIEPIVTIPPGFEVTVGGGDNFDLSQTESWANGLKSYLANYKALGFTSHETYVIWRDIETSEGVWDWTHYDACVASHEATGMKWVPFIILGPAYTIPDWFYHSADHHGYVCLEHNTETDIMSLWAPSTRTHVEEFITEFANHYKDNPNIESVLLGITGNYGEAIYPVSSGSADWTSDYHGDYHSHPGMWCGDPYALADFARWLEEKYGTIAALNTAWGTSYASFTQATPRDGTGGLHNRPWFDTVDWYRASMNEWIKFWMQETTEKMPGVEVYLCTGGHAPPQHGSEFGWESKIAAQYGGGVRITNEGDNYLSNFAVTRWVASASRFYNGFFAFEPAGFVDYRGVVARVFNATAGGALQLHSYDSNITGTEERTNKWKTYAPYLKRKTPVIRVAVWYPNRAMDLGEDVLGPMQSIREICDLDYMDNVMIRDGALAQYDILVGYNDGPYEQDVLQTVNDWVTNGGGTLLMRDFPISRIRSVEGDDSIYQAWKTNPNVSLLSYSNFYNDLRSELAIRGVLITGVNGLYVTEFTDGSKLYFNNNDADVQVPGTAITVPANGLYETPPDNEVWVDFNWFAEETGARDTPWTTLVAGATAVKPGGTVFVVAGESDETIRIAKAMHIEPSGGPVKIGGPVQNLNPVTVQSSIITPEDLIRAIQRNATHDWLLYG